MNAQEARQAVIAAIGQVAPEVDVEAAPPDALLSEDLDLDSMDVLNVVIAIAETTGVEISESDATGLESVDALAGYLVRRTGG